MKAQKNSSINDFLRQFSDVCEVPRDANANATTLGVFQVRADEYERRSKNQPDIKEPTSLEEIKALRDTGDMFTYYSLPTVRRTAMKLDVDPSSLAAAACATSSGQVHIRVPTKDPSKRRRATTLRRTCISVEAHPSVVLEDLLDDLYDD